MPIYDRTMGGRKLSFISFKGFPFVGCFNIKALTIARSLAL